MTVGMLPYATIAGDAALLAAFLEELHREAIADRAIVSVIAGHLSQHGMDAEAFVKSIRTLGMPGGVQANLNRFADSFLQGLAQAEVATSNDKKSGFHVIEGGLDER